MNKVHFQFYDELNDFLAPERRGQPFVYEFKGHPSVKDSTEALGVPHVEVDGILVNGTAVDFGYQLQDGDAVAVYPAGKCAVGSPALRLRPPPLPEARFVLDVHLGKLAGKMRMLGFDTLYRNDYEDAEIAELSVREARIVLTRDRGILMYRMVTHGYWIRSEQSDGQLTEVLQHFGLHCKVRAFHRCMACNGELTRMDKKAVLDRLQPRTITFFNEFYVCADCQQVYWKGSHYQQMKGYVEGIIRPNRNPQG